MSDTSGNASTGSAMKAAIPAPTNSASPSNTRTGRVSDARRMASSMAVPQRNRACGSLITVSGGSAAFQHLFQVQRAVDDDVLAGFHIADDFNTVTPTEARDAHRHALISRALLL